VLEDTFIGNDSTKDNFGCNIKINNDGTKIFIAYEDNTTGIIGVDIYKRTNTTWTLEDNVTSGILDTDYVNIQVPAHMKDFISINGPGTLLAVGNPGDLINSIKKGSFTFFNYTNTGWNKAETITPQSVIDQNNIVEYNFGWSVELSDDSTLCFVSIPSDIENAFTNRIAGAIFVYSITPRILAFGPGF
jgi:hypothetical protein